MSRVLQLQTLESLNQAGEFDNLLASTVSTICPEPGPGANGSFHLE